MKKLGLFIIQICVTSLLSLVVFASIAKADTGEACLPHFAGGPFEQLTRDCLEAPGGTMGAPAGACSLNCWFQGGSWHYHCTPQASYCTDGYTLAGSENSGNSPPGADLSANPQNKTIQCQGCNNYINCWRPLPSPTICPSPGPVEPAQTQCRHTDPNACGEIYQLNNNGQCGTTWNPTGQSCECPSPPAQKACSEPCERDVDCNGRIGGNCTQCLDNPNGIGKSCQQPPVPPPGGCRPWCDTEHPCQLGCGVCTAPNAGQCVQPSNTPVPPAATGTPVPTGTPAPTSTPVPAECVEAGEPDSHLPNGNASNPNGTSCSSIGDNACNGGWCYGYDDGPKCRTCSQAPPPGPPPQATPTPIQPTEEVSMIPTPTADPNRPTLTPVPPNTTGTPSNRQSQRWVCLQALPCSDPTSGCSVASDHRVRLSSKTTSEDPAQPLGGKDTYVFECLQTSTGNKCTTGDSDLDTSAVGSSNLSQLESTYGYSFGGMYYENGVDVAPNPIPAEENNNGNFGAREWESYTSSNINRMFLAMNNFDPNGVGGEIGAQQQGVLAFVQGGSKKCVQIRWDPYGEISDTWTLKPVPNAQVFLYQKNNDDSYSLVTDNSVLGGIQNPVTADEIGKYNFNVPDGSYRIEVKAPGYQTYQKDLKQTAGKQEEHKVELTPTTESLFQKAKDYLLNLLGSKQ